MKTINQIFDKLNKLPVWVGYVAVIVASMVAVIPGALLSQELANEYAKDLSNLLGQNITIVIYGWQKAGIVLLGGLVGWGIMELVSRIVLGWLQRSRFFATDAKRFKSTVRYCYAVYELIVGLCSLTSIWDVVACSYYIGILDFIVKTAIFTLGYLYIKDKCLNPNNISNAYNGLYMVHFIYFGALSTINIVSDIVNTDTFLGVLISDAVMLAVVVAGCILLYFTVYKPLQNEQKENRKRIVQSNVYANDDSDEIFRGYGM